MAYGDYGGQAFFQGDLMYDRSDVVLDEPLRSSPGTYPGFVFDDVRDKSKFHALVGPGPVYVGLYKSNHFEVCRGIQKVDLREVFPEFAFEKPSYEGEEVSLIWSFFEDNEGYLEGSIDGLTIRVAQYRDDYQAMLVQIEDGDGQVWTGYSGYGMGAGFEENPDGRSQAMTARLHDVFAGAPITEDTLVIRP